MDTHEWWMKCRAPHLESHHRRPPPQSFSAGGASCIGTAVMQEDSPPSPSPSPMQPPQVTKKRKATYLVHKEEQESLQKQVQALQRELQTLQDGGESERQKLLESLGVNAALRDAVGEQQIAVAGAQSLLSEWLQTQVNNPMSLPIRLGRDWAARRETLLGMMDERLARGFRYVTARCQHLKPLKPQFSEERFEDENGDFCCIRNEVVPFPGVQSLRKVFDAVRFTIDTMEISISEQLGQITLRDDYDTVEAGAFISNYRLASGLDCGVTAEVNAVVFAEYVDNHDSQPYCIVTMDTVDQDDLHPYHPQECVRKELHGSVLVLPVTRKKNDNNATNKTNATDSDEDEVVIVVMRSFFVKNCRPEFDVSEAAMQELQENVTRWGDVVLQSIRRIIYS